MDNWKEQFDKKFVQEGVSGNYVQLTMNSAPEVKAFIQSLLDQQNDALMAMAKREVLEKVTQHYDPVTKILNFKGLQNAIVTDSE